MSAVDAAPLFPPAVPERVAITSPAPANDIAPEPAARARGLRPVPTMAVACACGARAKFGRTCSRCSPRGPGLPPRKPGRPPRPREDLEEDLGDAELYQPITQYVGHVRDFAAERAREDERARLLSEFPTEKIKRLPNGRELLRDQLERTAKWAEEREAAEAKADAAARKRRHEDFLKESARDRRLDARDRRDRVGEWALDPDSDSGSGPAPERDDSAISAFRTLMISNGGRGRAAAQTSFGLSDTVARLILLTLVTDGRVPARTTQERRRLAKQMREERASDVKSTTAIEI